MKRSTIVNIATIIMIMLATMIVSVTITYLVATSGVLHKLDTGSQLGQCRSEATAQWDVNISDVLNDFVKRDDAKAREALKKASGVKDQINACARKYGVPAQQP